MKNIPIAVVIALTGITLMACSHSVSARVDEQVVDVPTRPEVTQRFLYLEPPRPKAALILFSGGNGDLKLQADGNIVSSRQNFLVRNRQLFAEHGFAVAVIDAPSDRQTYPFLAGFRETREHATDIKAVIAWVRQKNKIPVWLVGTSRGTESVAFIAGELASAGGGPDGIVLSSTILNGRAVPEMNVDRIKIPVLVVHHEQDGCKLCPYWQTARLMRNLSGTPAKELITITGGEDHGDPCQPMAHHGYNGQDAEVVGRIAAWITSH